MWRFLVNLFKKTDQSPELEVYPPKDRLIFQYWDGQKTIIADPLVLYRKIGEKGPEIDTEIKLAQSPSKSAVQGHIGAVTKIREIFGVKPVEEGGLTEIESINLLESFVSWCHDVKKN